MPSFFWGMHQSDFFSPNPDTGTLIIGQYQVPIPSIRSGTICLPHDLILPRYLGADLKCITTFRYWDSTRIAIQYYSLFKFFFTLHHEKKLNHKLLQTAYHEAYFQKQCTSRQSICLIYFSSIINCTEKRWINKLMTVFMDLFWMILFQ